MISYITGNSVTHHTRVYFKREVQPKCGVQNEKCGVQNSIWSVDSQEKSLKLLPPDVRF